MCAPLLSLGAGSCPTIDQSLATNYPESCVIRKRCYEEHSNGDERECDHAQTREWVILPDIICAHVLRFSEDSSKILPVDDDLSAPPFLKVGGVTYELRSVIEHIGESSRSGHYVARVRRSPSNSWYEMDDRVVRKSSAERAGLAPYIAFYQRSCRVPLLSTPF